MYPLILASGSQWRKKLLQDIGLEVDAVTANINEADIVGDTPIATAKLRAKAKAQDVFVRYPNCVIIGADQVCHLDGKTIGKPESNFEWFQRLQSFRGKGHYLTTAVTICSSDKIIECQETTTVYFRDDIDDDTISKYISIGEARGCAGGYMMEHKGAWLIKKIEGDWQNVIGLPIFALTEHLRSLGFGYFGENNE